MANGPSGGVGLEWIGSRLRKIWEITGCLADKADLVCGLMDGSKSRISQKIELSGKDGICLHTSLGLSKKEYYSSLLLKQDKTKTSVHRGVGILCKSMRQSDTKDSLDVRAMRGVQAKAQPSLSRDKYRPRATPRHPHYERRVRTIKIPAEKGGHVFLRGRRTWRRASQLTE